MTGEGLLDEPHEPVQLQHSRAFTGVYNIYRHTSINYANQLLTTY